MHEDEIYAEQAVWEKRQVDEIVAPNEQTFRYERDTYRSAFCR
jgi:hypothetical protein